MTNWPRLATSSSANSDFAKAVSLLSKSARKTHRLRTDCPVESYRSPGSPGSLTVGIGEQGTQQFLRPSFVVPGCRPERLDRLCEDSAKSSQARICKTESR